MKLMEENENYLLIQSQSNRVFFDLTIIICILLFEFAILTFVVKGFSFFK